MIEGKEHQIFWLFINWCWLHGWFRIILITCSERGRIDGLKNFLTNKEGTYRDSLALARKQGSNPCSNFQNFWHALLKIMMCWMADSLSSSLFLFILFFHHCILFYASLPFLQRDCNCTFCARQRWRRLFSLTSYLSLFSLLLGSYLLDPHIFFASSI